MINNVCFARSAYVLFN